MRRLLITSAAVLGLMGLVAPADAVTPGSVGLRAAADSVASVERTACWRYGWHGWGWYPWCGVVVAPGPGPCFGRGWHRVCNGWGRSWRVCN